MAKRQIKVSKDQLQHYISGEKYINLVLSNQAVILEHLISVQSDHVKIKNSRGHVLHLPLDQIDEIWAEEKVA